MSTSRRHELGALTEQDAEAILRAAAPGGAEGLDLPAAVDALLDEVHRNRPFGVHRTDATGMYSTTEPPSSPSWSPRAAAVLLAPRVVESWTPSGRFRAELRLVVRRSAGAAAFVAVVFAVCGAYLNGVMADFSGQDVVPARLAGAGIGALVGVGLVGAVALAMLVVRALVAGVQAVLARPTRSGRRAR